MSFAEKIKIVRTKCFLSQYKFAEKLGVSVTTVNRWETGKSKPNYNTMKIINDFCINNNIDFDVTNAVLEEKE